MFRRRLNTLYLAILGLAMILLVRMGQLQLIDGANYAHQSVECLKRRQLTHTHRGTIRDRKGRILAMDRPSLNVCVDYRALTGQPRWMRRTACKQWRRFHPGELLDIDRAKKELAERIKHMHKRLAVLSGLPPEQLAENFEIIRKRVEAIKRIVEAGHGTAVTIVEETSPQPLIENVSREVADRIAAELADMPWLSIDTVARTRHYPYGEAACHLIGIVGGLPGDGEVDFDRYFVKLIDGERERILIKNPRTDENLKGYVPWDRVGRSGIERLCETVLRGHRGLIRSHIDAHAPGGRMTDEVIDSIAGRDVRLTIDIELQREIEGLLDGAGIGLGAAVVIDVPTGEILALASAPRYDLNRYNELLAEMNADWRRPMVHRAAGGKYPPGSTVKPVTAIAGLQSGTITPHTTYNCRGYLHEPGKFRCHARWGHGRIGMYAAIEQSCNVYFYHVAEGVGSPWMQHWLDYFGFGRRIAIDVPAQKAGIVPYPLLVRRIRPREPGIRVGDIRHIGIGQGMISATPLQVANMMATFARRGRRIAPALTMADSRSSATAPTPAKMKKLKLDRAAVDAVREGLRRVVHGDKGTARLTVRMDNITVAGKTGTAETPPLRHDGQVVAACLTEDGSRRDHAWFAGFAPLDPINGRQVAIAVLVEYGGHGGVAAGPVAKRVLELCRKHGYLSGVEGES